ncbi:MAG: radical SAM protein [bacterium]
MKLKTKSNYQFHKIAFHTGLDLARPTFIWFKPTYRCNSKCSMCTIWRKGSKYQELSTQQWKDILLDVRKWLGRVWVGFQGGEVFLRNDMIEILRYASDIELATEAISNGLLIDRGLAKNIIDCGLTELRISLDGIRPETHNFIRNVEGGYEKVISAIEYLNELKEEKKQPRIVIQSIIMGYNIDEILNLVRFTQEKHLSGIYFQPLEQNIEEEEDVKWYEGSELWPKEDKFHKVVEVIDELIRMKRRGLPIINTIQHLEAMKPYFFDPEGLYRKAKSQTLTVKGNICTASLTNFIVYPDGSLKNCHGMEPIGNLTLESAKTLWKNRYKCWKKGCPLKR